MNNSTIVSSGNYHPSDNLQQVHTDKSSEVAGQNKTNRCTKNGIFHADMVRGAHFTGRFDLPAVNSTNLWPSEIISFPEAMSPKCRDFQKTVHFYTDDYRFERLWNSKDKYIEKLKKFNGAIGPDFSTCPNFPFAEIVHNTYRNATCTFWMQSKGIETIPNARCDIETANWALSYIPEGSIIAIGSHGCIKKVDDRNRFIAALKTTVEALKPSGIIVVGSNAYDVFDYPKLLGIPIRVFPIGLRGQRIGAAYDL